MRNRVRLAVSLLFTVLVAVIAPVAFQAQHAAAQGAAPSGFWLTTPYPSLTAKPGETVSVPLTLRNTHLPPQRATIEVSGVPTGWKWTLKGGSREIGAVMVAPGDNERITLELTPPAGSSGQNVNINVTARHGAETASLPLVVKLSEAATSGLTLEPELPALRGTARSTFTFKIKATNGGSEQALFNLAANVPSGFQARFKKGYGSEEITGVPINAGANESITLEVVPFKAADAGRYPVVMEVAGGDAKAVAQLSLEITGQPEVQISGPQERLSGEAVAGEEASFTFNLANNGSAPATDIELGSTPPSGWRVDFEPKQIAALAANSTREVAVKITPSERAVAGDYMVPVRATGGGISESVQFRTTVRTSTIWGAVGLGVIAIAVFVLGAAVMRYGRR